MQVAAKLGAAIAQQQQQQNIWLVHRICIRGLLYFHGHTPSDRPIPENAFAETKMLGFKRQTLDNCPDRSDHRKLSKDDAFSIYESTLRKLGCDLRLSWRMANSSPKIVPQAAAPALRCSCYPSTSAASVLPAHVANGSVHGQPVLPNSEAESHSVAAPDDDSACFHCRRNICPSCYRWCAGCQEKFCSICSLMDFSERDDRAFCLDCYGSKRTCSK